ncbi:hypothetical protein ABPG72_010126 [Tetrahymena utriculariae]
MEQNSAKLQFNSSIKEPEELDSFFVKAYQICEEYFINDKIQCYQNTPTQIPYPNCCFLVKKHGYSSKKLLTDMHVSYPSSDPRKETANFKYREGNYPLNKLVVRVIEAKNADILTKFKINKIKAYYIVHTFYSEQSENEQNAQSNQQQQPNNMFVKQNENFPFQNCNLSAKIPQAQVLPTVTQDIRITNNIPLDQILQRAQENTFNNNYFQQQNQESSMNLQQQLQNNINNCFIPSQDKQASITQFNLNQLIDQVQTVSHLYKELSNKYVNIEKNQQAQLVRILFLENQLKQSKSNIKNLKNSLQEKDKMIQSTNERNKNVQKKNEIQSSNLIFPQQSIIIEDNQNIQTSDLNQKRRSDYDISEVEQRQRKQTMLENYQTPNIQQDSDKNQIEEQTLVTQQNQTDQPNKSITYSQDEPPLQIQQILHLPTNLQKELIFFFSKTNMYQTNDNIIQIFAYIQPTFSNISYLKDLNQDTLKELVGWVQPTDQSFNQIYRELINQIDFGNQLILYKVEKSCLLLFSKEAIKENIDIDVNFMKEIPQQDVPFLVFYYYEQPK